jgi:hypothetical protein
MLNIVESAKEFVEVNFHSLPKSAQYVLVGAGAACLPVVQQALVASFATHHFDGSQLLSQCFTAVLAAHLAHRMDPPEGKK